VLVSWSHPGRLRSEAAFAMLAGVAPIEASSGRVVRHRLNRGGDRQLHTIVMIRQRFHETTKTYTKRRAAQGKSEREVRRCLTRAVARQLYRLLERTAVPPPPSGQLALPTGAHVA
jgi:transposase